MESQETYINITDAMPLKAASGFVIADQIPDQTSLMLHSKFESVKVSEIK